MLAEKLFTAAGMHQAYRRCRHAQAAWNDKVGLQEFKQRPDLHLMELLDALRSGRYRPCAVREHRLAKPDGGCRVIQAQMLQDKVAQRLVNDGLMPALDRQFSARSYAYRPKRSVAMAVYDARRLLDQGMEWVVQADIYRCFDQIPQKSLYKSLCEWVPDRLLQYYFKLWIQQYYHPGSAFGVKRGIMQGAVLSPLWCNCYLHPLDGFLVSKGLRCLRYADNFLITCETERQAEKALKTLGKGLKRLDMKLHPDKCSVSHRNDGLVFLGKSL